MTEIRPDGTVGKSIEVASTDHIRHPLAVFIDAGTIVRPTDFDELLITNQPMNGIVNSELRKKMEAQVLNPGLLYAEETAKEQIAAVRQSCGLPEVAENDMKCVYYTDEEYDQNLALVLGVYGMNNATALSNHELTAEIIRTHDHPNYLIGSYSLHELVHRYVDFKTRIFKKAPRQGYPDQEVILYDLNRAGLAVYDVTNHKFVGGVLNELGNYFVQAKYIRARIEDENPLIREETTTREQLLDEKYGEAAHIALNITVPSGRSEQIAFNRDKIHFDKKGDIVNISGMMYMQLADDINLLCSEENNLPFMERLLQAKANPGLTRELKQIIDTDIGEGYFHKLRNASYGNMDDLMNLLKEIQGIIYSFD